MDVLLGSLAIKPPERGNRARMVKRQAIRRTAGGTLFRYDKGLTTREYEWQWTELTQAERDSLETWFNTTVNGAQTAFSVRDWYGEWLDQCVVLDPVLEFTQTDEHRERGTGYGIWSTSLRFEAIPRGAAETDSGEES